jgi:hypothetical protein
MNSQEHGDVYKSIVKKYLKDRNILDYSKFQLALSFDKPIFLKWEYPANVIQPTEQYLLGEFRTKFDLSAPRRKMNLELRYIYIHATSIAHDLLRERLISKLDDPIYFNIDGEVIFPGSLVMTDVEAVKQFKWKTTIETIFTVDIETQSNYWSNTDKDIRTKLSVDNGMLKYINHPITITTTGHIRVLVIHQRKQSLHRANEIETVIKPVSSAVLLLSNEAMKSLQN